MKDSCTGDLLGNTTTCRISYVIRAVCNRTPGEKVSRRRDQEASRGSAFGKNYLLTIVPRSRQRQHAPAGAATHLLTKSDRKTCRATWIAATDVVPQNYLSLASMFILPGPNKFGERTSSSGTQKLHSSHQGTFDNMLRHKVYPTDQNRLRLGRDGEKIYGHLAYTHAPTQKNHTPLQTARSNERPPAS